jgi:hypothetical protein
VLYDVHLDFFLGCNPAKQCLSLEKKKEGSSSKSVALGVTALLFLLLFLFLLGNSFGLKKSRNF